MTENQKAMNIRMMLGRSDVMMLVSVLHRAAAGEFPGLDRSMARDANDLASLLLFAVEDADAAENKPANCACSPGFAPCAACRPDLWEDEAWEQDAADLAHGKAARNGGAE